LSSIQGFNFDKEKLDLLLKLFQQNQMSQEQAEELKQLLEPMHEEASNDGDLNRAREIASILVTLKGMLGGRLRPPDRICKRCGNGKVRAEKDSKGGKWVFPPKKVCRSCEEELYGEKEKGL
jgi:hypothetical protein